MKRIYSSALFLTIINLSPAQSPRMTVRDDNGTGRSLPVEQVSVTVRFLGDIAETELDLQFRNEGGRAVEGEFVLPLPDGATVSGYALEVNNNMRDGVAVEKDRARDAYESVKRRMIDPGIVEREAGNTYRTKVYPVPAKGTKRLRITYNETLHSNARELVYSLPLEFPGVVNSFSCKLSGTSVEAMRVTSPAGIEFSRFAPDQLTAERKETHIKGILKVSVRPPDGPQMIVGNEAKPAFFLCDRVPETVSRPRPIPAKVMLVWDASESGSERDHVKAIGLLESWFAKLGSTQVALCLLRDRLEDGGKFEVRDGRCEKLKQVLQQVDYDGATAISRLQIPAGKADLVVFVGDGVATLGTEPPAVAAPLIFIRRGSGIALPALVRLARTSGGSVIDLAGDDPATALAGLTQQPLRLLSLKGSDVEASLLDQDLKSGQVLRITGTLRERRAGKIELSYGFGNAPVVTREVIYQPGGGGDNSVRRLHAQCVLAELEQQEPRDTGKIIAHCKRYGLVSDYTSLIVLERIEDYAAYQIPPPEPELQAEYNKLVQQRATSGHSGTRDLAWVWEERLHWFRQSFPGYAAVLMPRIKQVRIWKQAVESQFAPAQRDAAAFATIAGWLEKAVALTANNPKPNTRETYQKWQRAIDDLNAQGAKLAQTPLHPPPAGQALVVSVRWMVDKPDLVTGEVGMTLRQAIEKAGGTNPLGGLNNVALYRNAGKTVYNTLSGKFQDIPLFPADMIVVGQPFNHAFAGVDPFASPSTAKDDPKDASKDADPIIEQRDLWPTGSERSDAFVPSQSDNASDPFGDGRRNRFPVTPASPSSLGGGFPMTPATPSGRHHGGGAPQLPNSVGPGAADPVPDPVTGEAPAQANQPKDANIRAIDRNEILPPGMATFAKDLAASRDPATVYRTLKGRHFHQPNFYLEAARVLFANRQPELARRVLSNIVEARPGNASALRSYAYWLAEFGQPAEAEAALRTVSANDPAAWQVTLDRASFQAACGDTAAATSTLTAFFTKLPACASGSLAAMALTELNAALPANEMPHLPNLPHHSRINYRQNLAADIRIVVTSTGDDDALMLSVREPGALGYSNHSDTSIFGGRIATAPNVREYMIRRAVPGTYQIHCDIDQTHHHPCGHPHPLGPAEPHLQGRDNVVRQPCRPEPWRSNVRVSGTWRKPVALRIIRHFPLIKCKMGSVCKS